MYNEYEIIDEYGYDYPEILDNIIKKTLELEKIDNSIFNIIFVDNEKIQSINKEYRNKDSITDVISFAFLDNNRIVDNEFSVLGDIFISIPKMKSQAEEYEHSEIREISFLVVHGLLHLLGYDHLDEEDEKVMFKKQEMILDEYEETKKKR